MQQKGGKKCFSGSPKHTRTDNKEAELSTSIDGHINYKYQQKM